jgi:hypothetical protein
VSSLCCKYIIFKLFDRLFLDLIIFVCPKICVADVSSPL